MDTMPAHGICPAKPLHSTIISDTGRSLRQEDLKAALKAAKRASWF